MKTKKIIHETDLILKKIKLNQTRDKENKKLEEKLEAELLDSLLKEINKTDSSAINEYSFFGAIKGIFKQLFGVFYKSLETAVTGGYEHSNSTYSSSLNNWSKAANRDTSKKLDPDGNPKDLVIFALGQMALDEASPKLIEIVKEKLSELGNLKAPIPNPNGEDAEEWKKGGASVEIINNVAGALGRCQGRARFLSEIMTKDWPEVLSEMESKTKPYFDGNEGESMITLLDGIIIFCDAIETSNWKKAIENAAKIQAKYPWAKDQEISPDYMVSGCASIKSVVQGQISRLNAALEEIEKQAKEAGADIDASSAESGTATESKSIEKNLIDSLLKEILKK